MKTFFTSLLLVILLIDTTPLFAATDGMTREEAISIAKQKHPGRVLAVKRRDNTYLVKILDSHGKVKIVSIHTHSDTGKTAPETD